MRFRLKTPNFWCVFAYRPHKNARKRKWKRRLKNGLFWKRITVDSALGSDCFLSFYRKLEISTVLYYRGSKGTLPTTPSNKRIPAEKDGIKFNFGYHRQNVRWRLREHVTCACRLHRSGSDKISCRTQCGTEGPCLAALRSGSDRHNLALAFTSPTETSLRKSSCQSVG